MDKVYCNIIRDLLPLYADDVVSPESKAMVDAHLANCSECREILDEIRRSVPVPQHSDKTLFKKIRRKQQIKSIALAVVIALFFYALIGAPIVAYVKDSFVEYNEDDCIVSESQDGSPRCGRNDPRRRHAAAGCGGRHPDAAGKRALGCVFYRQALSACAGCGERAWL